MSKNIYKETANAVNFKILRFYGKTAYALSEHCGITSTALQSMANGVRAVTTARTAVILETAFPDNDMSAQDWLSLDIDQRIKSFKANEKNQAMLASITPTLKEK